MAIPDIIRTLLPTFATDQVAIFTQDFTQLFRSARAIKATVKEQTKIMEHPVETGIVITDHRIVLPIEIELTVMLSSYDYRDVYKNIKQYYTNATLLVVQTRSDTYQNMIIEGMPHEETPDAYDAIPLSLNLKQVIFVTPQYGVVPKSPSNSNTAKRGVQQGTPATPKQATYGARIVDSGKRAARYIRGLFS